MTQINLLQGFICLDLFGQGGHLLLGQNILGKVNLAQRKNREEFSNCFPRELVVIQVNILEVWAVLNRFDQDLDSFVVNFVICQVELSQGSTLGDELGDLLGSSSGNLII